MLNKLPITVVMCVYNEEGIIEETLRSVVDYVSEIVVVHDGPCNDRTGEIVKKYGGKFIENKKNTGEAELIRIQSYKLATQKYILQLDADESLTSELQKTLADAVASDADYITVIWSHYRYTKKVRTLVRRPLLFKKDKIYFIECPHESPRPKKHSTIKHYDVDLFNDAGDRYKDQALLDNNQLKKQAKWVPIHADALIRFKKLKRFNTESGDKGSLLNELMSSRFYFLHGYVTIPALFTVSTLITALKFRQDPFLLFSDITVHNTRYYRDLALKIKELKNG